MHGSGRVDFLVGTEFVSDSKEMLFARNLMCGGSFDFKVVQAQNRVSQDDLDVAWR